MAVYTQTNDDPCISYKDLSHLARNTSSAESAPCGLDPVPTGWYRFDISGVGQVITDCPVENECGTGNRIWINGIKYFFIISVSDIPVYRSQFMIT